MEIDGKCLCGSVTYRARIDPEKVVLCHCTDCQTNSGSAFRVITPVPKDDFHLLTGELKKFIKTAQSGAERALAFCPDCGTSFYGTEAVNPQTLSLRVGTATQAAELTPSLQVWHRSALGWLSTIGELPKFDEQTPPRR